MFFLRIFSLYVQKYANLGSFLCTWRFVLSIMREYMEYRKTPLMYACMKGHLEVVNVLISKGAEINANDRYRKTPLMYASMEGHQEVVKLLIGKGADVNYKDENGRTPLIDASMKGNLDMVKVLIYSPDINTRDTDLNIALQYASRESKLELVMFLIDNGADVNKRDDDFRGLPPLIHACRSFNRRNKLEVIKVLIEHGADVNVSILDINGEPSAPLIEACRNCHVEVVKLLIDKGAHINIYPRHRNNKHKYAPLMVAYKDNKRFEIVTCLLDNGADIKVLPKGQLQGDERLRRYYRNKR
eukprot:GHVR01137276.1.p1 GENE.GHVR01137276.1~~GHVR01137276.1.p1  ORF type:complete len:300 (+),score=10.48 GHVR01137276.1:492-1391(+)